MFLPREYRKYFENQAISSVNIAKSKVVKRLTNLYGINFLTELQELHDHPSQWDENGLTHYGRTRVISIKHSIENGDYTENE